jgi:hypothetical protein
MGGLLMHYQWTSRADFDTWHTVVCDALGIPHPNHNAATGELDLNAQWTTAYTDVVKVADDDWRAFVEDNIATQFPDGLGIPSEPFTESRETDEF